MKFAICLAVTLMLFVGCSDKPSGPLTGAFELYIQDDVADYDSVIVTIDTVAIIPQSSISGWNTIYTNPTILDLTTLRNGQRQLIIQRDLPAGFIGGVKLIFGTSRLVIDGTSHDLHFDPALGDSGVAYNDILITKDRTARALVDIDVANSISFDFGDSIFYFRPSLSLIDLDSAGAIYGSISPQADIYLLSADTTFSFSVSNPGGNYGFFGLPQAIFDIRFEPRGLDTLTYDTLRNYDVAIYPPNQFNLGHLDLPLRGR